MTDITRSERIQKVRLEILARLDGINERMLRRNILFADLNLHLAPRATLAEFNSELATLEAKGLVVIVADPLDGPDLVKITPGGIAELAANK